MKRIRSLAFAMAIFGLAAVFVAVAPAIGDTTERLPADTAKTTVEGNTFIAPAGWTITTGGTATILEAPEGDSHIAFVDVRAPNADAAVAAAWQAYKPDAQWPLKVVSDSPDQDGWTDRRTYTYQTSPNEKRYVEVSLQRANDVWTAVVYDMTEAVGDKRIAQVVLIYGELLPKGYTRESFAGRKGAQLDAAKLAELRKFVEDSMKARHSGVAVGIVQGRQDRPGRWLRRSSARAQREGRRRSLFMIGSNTKAMTTLMLAKLVDEKKVGLGDAGNEVASLPPSSAMPPQPGKLTSSTSSARATGMPRQDLEGSSSIGGPDDCESAQAYARDHAAYQRVWRDVPVFEPPRRCCWLGRWARRLPAAGTGRGIRQGNAGKRVRSAGNERDDLRLHRRPAR